MTLPEKQIEKYLVTQSNRLIEADYSDAKLPARALKIGRLIVSKISPDDKDFRLIKVKNRAIKQYLGYKSSVPYNRFNSDLEDICKRLNDQPVRIRTEKDTILNAFFISSWEIDLKTGVTVFEISGRLKEYLLELRKNYTSYQLENIPKLNSSYSIRMYELLSQYRRIGTRKFELEDLKRKIGCNYDMYGHFKKKALEKAHKDLKAYTDLRFEFEEIKTGRKVSDLIFYIYPNDPESTSKQGVLSFLDDAIEVQDNNNFSNHVAERLIEVGISANNLEKYLSKGFDVIEDENARQAAQKRCKTVEAYYLEKLTLLDQSKSKINPAGFLIKALKEDWISPKLSQKAKSKDKNKERLKAEKELWKLERLETDLLKKYETVRQSVFDKIIENDQDEFLRIYESIEDSHTLIKLKKPSLSPLENYKHSIFLRIRINEGLEGQHAEKLEEANALNQELQRTKDQIAEIKKQWNL